MLLIPAHHLEEETPSEIWGGNKLTRRIATKKGDPQKNGSALEKFRFRKGWWENYNYAVIIDASAAAKIKCPKDSEILKPSYGFLSQYAPPMTAYLN